jgi:uncharacterized membrane protein YdjX (TVP38/TMEM64 family)
MQIFSSRRNRWRGFLFVFSVMVAFLLLYLAARRYTPFIFDAQALRAWIAQFGIVAPLVFIFVQALQVVIAPIPGQAVALVAGYLFGAVAGTIYSLTGVLIGSAVAFSLAKRYGRPFVETILHEDVIERFDSFVDRIGIQGLFVFVIIPGLPDDAICFLSGLTKLRLRTFLVVISIGRLPAYVFTVYAGGKLADGRFIQALVIIGIVISLSVIGYAKQEAIRDRVQQLESRLRA